MKYPQCLYFLDAVQNVSFREALASGANAKFIEDQQLLQWHYYLRKAERLKVRRSTVPHKATTLFYKSISFSNCHHNFQENAKTLCGEGKEEESSNGVKEEKMEIDF